MSNKLYHETLCMGCRVKVYSDGSIEVIGEPVVKYCPYMEKVYGVKRGCVSEVLRVIKHKIREYGLFTSSRRFGFNRIVLFGSSEIISWGVENGFFDSAVIVCDGAGTIVTGNPKLIQGVGARMNGLLKTYPIPEVIRRIKELGGYILDENKAVINQPEGFKLAVEKGFKKIAVTIIGVNCRDVSVVRKLEEEYGVKAYIFSTCNTLAGRKCIEHLEKSDYVCTSASKLLRESLAPKALMQIGVTIPVYILTRELKNIVLDYVKSIDEQIVVRRARIPLVTPKTPCRD